VKAKPSDAGHNEISIEITGKNLSGLSNEAGGHRIQRVPPTEKRGRVHTSTVTVAVIDPESQSTSPLARRANSDYRIEWFSGSGAGVQHRNKHQNSCRMIHIPTGLVETCQGREREANQRQARASLDARLDTAEAEKAASIVGGIRNSQIGSGMRGDKTVTIRFQDDRVTNHTTGKIMSASKYMRGLMREAW